MMKGEDEGLVKGEYMKGGEGKDAEKGGREEKKRRASMMDFTRHQSGKKILTRDSSKN